MLLRMRCAHDELLRDRLALRNTHFFLSFSLCLSRACLGKKMNFSIEWRKKGRRFSHHVPHRHLEHRHAAIGTGGACKKTHHLFFECFPYVCPEPVLIKRSFLVQNGSAEDAVFLPVASCIEPHVTNMASMSTFAWNCVCATPCSIVATRCFASGVTMRSPNSLRKTH